MARPDLKTLGMITAVLVVGGCKSAPGGHTIADRSALRRFAPVSATLPQPSGPSSDALVSLGRMLYYDTRLSASQMISCNSCHPLDSYGVDGQPTSTGFRGQRGERNAPSVYNAAAQFVQFWDGRSGTVEEQAKGPMLNPAEMAMPSPEAVVVVLRSMPGYVEAFRKAFPGDRSPVTFDHAAEAIGAFERRLVTPSRWDAFLANSEAALFPAELDGLNVFVEEGCANCHAGALIGGDAYRKLGAAREYPDGADPGRYKVTRREADRMFFKVPSLRNVAVTAPYFHNGKAATLPEAVALMGEFQLGKRLSDRRVEAIVVWLKTLTGDVPAAYIRKPALPSSTPRTPKAIGGD